MCCIDKWEESLRYAEEMLSPVMALPQMSLPARASGMQAACTAYKAYLQHQWHSRQILGTLAEINRSKYQSKCI